MTVSAQTWGVPDRKRFNTSADKAYLAPPTRLFVASQQNEYYHTHVNDDVKYLLTISLDKPNLQVEIV